MTAETSHRKLSSKSILPASAGVGPLIQRDYWIVLERSGVTAADLIARVLRDFADFAPAELASFRCADESALGKGAEMDIAIALAGKCGVRLVHQTHTSFTLRTLEGHPEAGRITFGAAVLGDGRLEFRIRSRARAAHRLAHWGYALLGRSMQTDMWVEFVTRVAEEAGGDSPDGVQISEREVSQCLGDTEAIDVPTFRPGRG